MDADVQGIAERCGSFNMRSSFGLERWGERRLVASSRLFKTRMENGGAIFQTGAVRLRSQVSASAVRGRGSFVLLGDSVSLNGTRLHIDGEGSAILIGPGCRLKGVTVRLSGADCILAIGAGSSWESGTCIGNYGRAIMIGDDCMISNDVMIRSADGHSVWDARTRQRISLPADVCIEPHVWIGNGSRVSKGARIGTGCVVGQMSLVTGTLRPRCVYGGVPARLLREDVEWSRTLRYESIPEQFRHVPEPVIQQGG